MQEPKVTLIEATDAILDAIRTIDGLMDLSRCAHVEPGSMIWRGLMTSQSRVDALIASGLYEQAILASLELVEAWKIAINTPKDFRFEGAHSINLACVGIEKETKKVLDTVLPV
jgi:hypothetical protein